jgi:hypothetical protein
MAKVDTRHERNKGESMIQIKSFIPLANLRRDILEFHEDKIIRKTKSLTVDFETEIKYENIKYIVNRESANFTWFSISFIISAVLIFVQICFDYFDLITPTFLIIEKVIVIFSLALVVPAFLRSEYYCFQDENNVILAVVKIDNNNRKTVLDAIKLIKQKINLTYELYLNEPLPSIPPVFEYTELDIPDFINKSTVRVYEDRIINVEKTLVERITTVIKFDQLSGRTTTARIGNDKWVNIWFLWLEFIVIAQVTTSVLGFRQLISNKIYLDLFLGGFILLIPMFLMKYIKNEILFFYNHKDNSVFWTYVNSKNRKKIYQVVSYIQGKIANNKKI